MCYSPTDDQSEWHHDEVGQASEERWPSEQASDVIRWRAKRDVEAEEVGRKGTESTDDGESLGREPDASDEDENFSERTQTQGVIGIIAGRRDETDLAIVSDELNRSFDVSMVIHDCSVGIIVGRLECGAIVLDLLLMRRSGILVVVYQRRVFHDE